MPTPTSFRDCHSSTEDNAASIFGCLGLSQADLFEAITLYVSYVCSSQLLYEH